MTSGNNLNDIAFTSPNSIVNTGTVEIIHSSDSSEIEMEKNMRGGTVLNTSMNTLTNIVGGSILSLPFAVYNGSLVISVLLLIICIYFAGFSVFCLTYGAEALQKFSYTEVLAFALFPENSNNNNNNNVISMNNITMKDDGMSTEDLNKLTEQGRIDRLHELRRRTTFEDFLVYDPARETTSLRRRRVVTMLMELVVFFNNFGSLIMYPRIMADAMPFVLSHFTNAKGVWVSRWLWFLIPSIVFFILSCARNLHELKITSLLGFMFMFYFVIVIIIRYFQNLDHPLTNDPLQEELSWFRISIGLFSTISTYSLAICYHYNVPYYYRELKDRRPINMMKTIVAGLPIIFITYGATAVLGYLTFGAATASKSAGGNIVNNYPHDDVLVNIARLGLFFHFAFVYPMHSVCARRELHRFICFLVQKPKVVANDDINNIAAPIDQRPPGDPATTSRRSIIIESFLVVVIATVIGASVPGIGVVIEATGCLFGVPLMFTLPGVIGLAVFKEGVAAVKGRNIKLCRFASWINVIVGMIFLICGIVAFIIEQINKKKG